jgi:hypothetical protein
VSSSKNAVVPDAQAENARLARERPHAGQTWVVLKGEKPLVDSLLNVPCQRQEDALGRRLEGQVVAPHLRESRLPADLLVGHGPGFFAGGPHGVDVEAIFEILEELQVFNGHQRRNRLPMSFEDDTFAFERHTIEGIGEPVPNGRGGKTGHGSFCTV